MKLGLNLFKKAVQTAVSGRSATSGRAILDFLSEFAYLALIFLVPLWFYYGLPNYNIFELNKIILFKVFVLLLFVFTFLRVIFCPPHLLLEPKQFFKKYWCLPTVFIIGLSLTLLSSIDPVLSFYGIFERQMGLSSYLFFFLWFILVSFNLLSDMERKIKRLVTVAVISGTLVAIYGLLQIFNIDFFAWSEPPYLTHRAFSSLGQPNFLASWLLLVIPLSGYLIYINRRLLVKGGFILALLVQLACLFFTGSRGGLLSLFVALIVFLVYLLVSSSWSRNKKIFIVLAATLIGGVALISFNYFSSGRLNNLANYNVGSVGARLNFYVAAASASKVRPLLGYGLETGNKIFISYYQSDWGVYDNVGSTTDRAHNLILDILLSAGVVGLLLFAAFYYFFFWLARANIKQKKQTALSLSLALAAVAYLFSLLFSFTIVIGEIYFWLFLALLVAINYTGDYGEKSDNGEEPKKNFQLTIIKFGVALIFIIFAGYAIRRELRTAIADYYFAEIYYFQPDYFTASVLHGYLQEQKVNPINQETYDRLWGERLAESYPFLEELAVRGAVAEKLRELDSSLSFRTYQDLLVKAKINRVLGDFSVAKDYLSALIKLAPHWPPAYIEAAQLAVASGDLAAARYNYTQAASNLPDPADPRLNAAHRRTVLNYQDFISTGRAALDALK
jgi:putative inorganic carbon (HCO3(-)) transporter